MKLTLPVPPSVNAMYSNIPGRGRIKTREYKAWVLNCFAHTCEVDESVRGPVVISIAVPENRRRDLDNYAKPILDLLCHSNFIDGDNGKTVRGISMCWHDEPDVHVTVEAAAI